MNCLVIIDVQKYFINRYSKYVVKRISNLAKEQHFDHIVATRFVNNKNSPYVKLLNWRKVMDKESQTIPDEIAGLTERIFEKNLYTCFTPEFKNFVKENKIDHLYFCGIDTDCCVLKSAADAFEAGIHPVVIESCCASHGGWLAHRAAIRVIKRLIGCQSVVKNMEDKK